MLTIASIGKEFKFLKLIQSSIKIGTWNGVASLNFKGNGYFHNDIFEKERIVLHYTAGSLAGSTVALTTTGHVSVPFLIGETGRLIVLFDPKKWAYHLGKESIGGNTKLSQTSIGIELVNWGWLTEKDGNLYTYLGQKYCSLADTSKYIRKEFREKEYWATFTDAQYVTLNRLLPKISEVFNIPLKLLPEELRLETTRDAITFNGIITHTNLRPFKNKEKKWDIGPAFDWNRLTL